MGTTDRRYPLSQYQADACHLAIQVCVLSELEKCPRAIYKPKQAPYSHPHKTTSPRTALMNRGPLILAWTTLLICLQFASGCNLETDDPIEQTDVPSRTSMEDAPGIAPGDPSALSLPSVGAIAASRFVTSGGCALCHSNHANATAMRDDAGNEIAPFNLWQGTMMANSGRDPFWRAMVSAETNALPSKQLEIEADCMRCHTPMASVAERDQGREPDMSLLSGWSPWGIQDNTQLALDGVSCSVCHQILPDNLGERSSWSGGFTLGTERKIFGPHENPATGPMQNHVDYTPTYSDHVEKSELCATCHTLSTTPMNENGDEIPGAMFHEQTVYLEWANSAYKDSQTCQNCHMPTKDDDGHVIETRIARAPPGFDFNINERTPFGRHAFVGANALIPTILKQERDILNPQATDEAFDATIAIALNRLQELTADIALENIVNSDEKLSFDINITSQVGHKFPTGFPSRRAWLRVEILDENGESLFVSGDSNDEGRLVDGHGDVLDVEKAGGGVEPHHEKITRGDAVQIYEAVMGNRSGARTVSLMQATDYIKDNRILPLGFSADGSYYGRIAPIGTDTDADFQAGQDSTSYEVAVSGAKQIKVSLLYQSLGARFARDLFQSNTEEVAAFRTMYERADVAPIEVASLKADLQD
jgi:hypothetical protein